MLLHKALSTIILAAGVASSVTVVFQQGAGYYGAKDVELREKNANYGGGGVFPITGKERLSIVESSW